MSRAALHRYIAEARAKPFRYGRFDCAMFAAGWLYAHCGRDMTLGIRYDSLRAGRAALEAAGYADHIALAAALLNEISVLRAQAGDIVVRERALGIVTGEQAAFATRRGLGFVPLTSCDRAFRA